MPLSIRHKFHSGKPTGPDATKVQGPHWDDDHDIVDTVTGLPLGPSATLVPVGTVVDYAGIVVPAGWLECAGQLVASGSYLLLHAALVKIASIDVTIGTPAVVTWAAHGLPIGSTIQFSTTGALPTGIVAGTKYYINSVGYTSGSFRISATFQGATVNTSGTQSGIHTATHAPFGVSGPSFYIPDFRERVTAGASIMASSATATPVTLNYAVGETAGTDGLILSTANLPAHVHTVNPASATTSSDSHTHTVSGSGSGSGTTGNIDVGHAHALEFEYWNSAQGSGGHSALQPTFQAGADGLFGINTNFPELVHSHPFSVSVSITGTTSSDSHTHTVNIAEFDSGSVGSGTAISLLQPTTFIRKIIFAGV